ncbi:hypothetical protein PIB30_048412 [Stylosanthes scabra]|uniref:Uncharacterized protein n=1 Tax=Stylosanthes scabra TaxID=79078 RepID=A0ABU6RH11_9FABA|nr:hypothetical protein [Stylosanthes scabra]
MKAKDTTTAVKAGSMSSNGATEADTVAAVKCEGTTAVRAGSTETPHTAGNGQGEAAVGGLAGKPHHRWGGTSHTRVRSDPSSATRTKTTRRHPRLRRSRGPAHAARGRVPPEPRLHPSGMSSCRAYSASSSSSSPLDYGSSRPLLGAPSPFRRISGLYIRARLPRAGASRRRTIRSLSPETQLGAHHPATEIPWDLAAGDLGSGTAGDRQPPTTQCIPYWANRGEGWARSESDDLRTSGFARSRTSMQALRATICRCPWPWRQGTRPGSQGARERAAHRRTAPSLDRRDKT